MEQHNCDPDRMHSASKDQNNSPNASSQNLNPTQSTIAVQAAFRKNRSHTKTELRHHAPEQDQYESNRNCVGTARKNGISPCNSLISDMTGAPAPTTKFAVCENQSIKSKPTSSARDELGPRKAPCQIHPSNETDSFVKSSDGYQPDCRHTVADDCQQDVRVYSCRNDSNNQPEQQPTAMCTGASIPPAPPCFQCDHIKRGACPREAYDCESSSPCFPPDHGVTGKCVYPQDANFNGVMDTSSRPCPCENQPPLTSEYSEKYVCPPPSLPSKKCGVSAFSQEVNACSAVKDTSSRPCPTEQQRTRSGSSHEICVPYIPQPPPLPPCLIVTAADEPKNKVHKDPACDPDKPYILQFQDVSAAAFMIRNAITITPCVSSRLSRMYGMDIYLKKDFMQLTGSFKERGARYALLKLTPEQRANGIVAASLGNHALALACHGAQLDIPVTVVMPTRAPLAKVTACRAYGANLIIEGVDLADSKNIALKLAETKGLTYINGYDHPHVMAGQGTLGLELLEQVCDVDAIIIPVGGGGLIAGVATAAKTLYPNIKIIAVESENCASFSAAQEAGKPVLVESKPTIADGLAVPMVGVNAFASAAPLVDRTVVVSEDLISLAILRITEVEKNTVEGAGAAGIAAVMSGQIDDFKDKRVVILACGGNIDVSLLGRCLERGMIADGRFISFTVFTDQNPTSLSDLFGLLGRVGASIKDMAQDRRMDSESFFLFSLKITVETPGAASSRELRTALSQMYKKICFHHNVESLSSSQPLYPDLPTSIAQTPKVIPRIGRAFS